MRVAQCMKEEAMKITRCVRESHESGIMYEGTVMKGAGVIHG